MINDQTRIGYFLTNQKGRYKFERVAPRCIWNNHRFSIYSNSRHWCNWGRFKEVPYNNNRFKFNKFKFKVPFPKDIWWKYGASMYSK